MVQLNTANIGSYPRVGDTKEEQKLRRAISKFEQNEISEQELTNVQHEVIRDVIGEQLNAGVDQVTDGKIRWYCPFSHMVRKMDGTEINGLVRYFDTNFYFRQPLIHDEPERIGSIAGVEFDVAQEASPVPVRQVLTGPFTLARYSIPAEDAERDLSRRELAFGYAETLAEEIEDLRDRGAQTVQLDEHGLRDAEGQEDEELLVEALRKIEANVHDDIRLSAAFSYGSPSRALPLFRQLPVDEVVVDLVYNESIRNELPEYTDGKDLVLGVLNARNTRLESPEEVASDLKPLIETLDRDRITLSPSTGLELLPRNRAQDKLSVLVDLKNELNQLL